jgi:hypothetical protein
MLSLRLPDDLYRFDLDTNDSECPSVDQAVRSAEVVWNTPAGRAALDRHIAKYGSKPSFDWGWLEANETAKSGIDIVCGNGVSLERATEATFKAAVVKLAEVHGEHGAHEIVKQWYDEMFSDVGSGMFGPVFRDADDIDPEDFVTE